MAEAGDTRVYIVDDDPNQLVITREYLISAGNGFDIETFDNAEEAFQKVLENCDTLDLLILDINIDRIDGLTFAKRLKRKGLTIPILFITGTKSPEVEAAVRRMGKHVDILYKPFDAQQLRQKINDLLYEASLFIMISRISAQAVLKANLAEEVKVNVCSTECTPDNILKKATFSNIKKTLSVVTAFVVGVSSFIAHFYYENIRQNEKIAINQERIKHNHEDITLLKRVVNKVPSVPKNVQVDRSKGGKK